MTKEERITHWRAIMVKQSASGLSVAAFCREHDIRAHQFHWWRHRLRKIDFLAKESGFIKLVPITKPLTFSLMIVPQAERQGHAF